LFFRSASKRQEDNNDIFLFVCVEMQVRTESCNGGDDRARMAARVCTGRGGGSIVWRPDQCLDQRRSHSDRSSFHFLKKIKINIITV
jgi:hypothetical protein